MKLGALLEDFPKEWHVSSERRQQLIQLTKNVLAASLAIEQENKVLKALSRAIALHRPWRDGPGQKEKADFSDMRGLDLSGARAADAYWARADLSYGDLYRADLAQASLRRSILTGAQCRETDLREAVLIDADCRKTNFKVADLRGADFTRANLEEANFENAKVADVVLTEAQFGSNPDCVVDVSSAGDGSEEIRVDEWLGRIQS